MRLSWLLSLPAVLSLASAVAIDKRDADFLSVRTKMHKDMSGRRGDPKDKYFHSIHIMMAGKQTRLLGTQWPGLTCDRFADHQLGYRERKQALSNLIQTYLATMSDVGVETWLMHGTLLGWWWNRKVGLMMPSISRCVTKYSQILPWDSDSDVQVSEPSIQYLASYYNMSVFHYKTPRIPEGRDYMLEINPHYANREQTDKLNVIDARWVDTTSGLFIDITTARYNLTHPSGEGMLSCKDGHEYRDTYIFPLRDTFFEGTPAKIPFAYKEVLEAEYKKKALTLLDYEGHHFDEDKLEWVPVNKKYIADAKKKAEEKKKEKLAEDVKAEEQKALGAPEKQNQQPNSNQAESTKLDGPQVVKKPTNAGAPKN
ncbi:Protein MNN4 [Lachnellula willkommii]|uniref:Protein MNN4 n=1 Tax=Lachnellula willkommii TaxID=215461 RepID=A0A559MJ18_9HELO|nr:Protein MNN4 [Lachnellula willkommii]